MARATGALVLGFLCGVATAGLVGTSLASGSVAAALSGALVAYATGVLAYSWGDE